MATISKIFDVFSQRPDSSTKQKHAIPTSTRNRILMWCTDIFSGSRSYGYQSDYRNQFWQEIRKLLQYRHGKLNLVEGSNSPNTSYEDVIYFLNSCSGEELIDFTEYIFRVDCRVHIE